MGQWLTSLNHHGHLLIIVNYATLTELQRVLQHLILVRALRVVVYAATHRRLLPVNIGICSLCAMLDDAHHELVQLPTKGRCRVLPAAHAA